MITNVPATTLTAINVFVAEQMGSFYPPLPPPEVIQHAPDLVNRTVPGDMSLTNGGTLISAEISPQDLGNRSGCPSPGIWALYWPLQLVAILVFAVSATACLSQLAWVPRFWDAIASQAFWIVAGVLATGVASFFLRGVFGTLTKWLSIIGVGYLLFGELSSVAMDYYWASAKTDAFLLLPTALLGGMMLLVLAEQELSANLLAVAKAGAVGKLLLPPLLLLLAWWQAVRGGGLFQKSVLTLLLVIAVPILVPVTTVLMALVAMFWHRIILTAYFAGREKVMRDTSRDARQAGMRKDIAVFEKARHVQMENAMRDMTPFFALATSQGYLRRDGDLLTPDQGAVLGLTEKDLRTNLFVFGKMGSGKTASVARPLVHGWRTGGPGGKACGGMLLLDGKSALPLQMKPLLDRVADPFRAHLNILAGVSPEAASLIFRAVCGGGKEGGSKDIWVTTPEAMIRQALFVIQAMHRPEDPATLHYCIRDLHAFCMNPATQQQRLAAFFGGELGKLLPGKGYVVKPGAASHLAAMPPHLRVAFEYFLVVLPKLPDDTRGSILFTVDAWLSSTISHSIMHRWAGHQSDFDLIGEIEHGAMVGVSAPKEVCGSGGALGLAMVKEALYQRLLSRGADPQWAAKGGKSVLIMVDEVSAIVSDTDAEAASKLRSLCGSMVFLTQTIEQLQQALGEKGAEALLSCFSSAITFTSSPATLKWSAQHAGMRHRVITDKQAVDVARLLDDVSSNNAASDGRAGRVGALVDTATDAIVRLRGQASISKEAGDRATESRQAATTKGTYEHATTVTADELAMFLAVPHTALVTLNRAGAPRREIARFAFDVSHPMHAEPTQEQIDDGLLPPDTYIPKASQPTADLAAEESAWLLEITEAAAAWDATIVEQLDKPYSLDITTNSETQNHE